MKEQRKNFNEVPMSAFDHNGFVTALPLNEGLLDWTRRQSRDTWHELAKVADFTAQGATIDLLLALHWVSQHPDCDRATALLILTRALQAGLHGKDCPPQMAPQAAKAFCKGLHNALKAGCFLQETLLLTDDDKAAITAQLGDDGPFALPADLRATAGETPHRPAYGFAHQRPVMPPLAA
jgi:hypothetical protein